jgi:hypothetical protein
MKHLLRPTYFFFGIILGFLMCSITGYFASKHTRYHHFLRFTSYISPLIDYFPTASELLVTAEHEVNPDKILVLIGGSSILRGEGQNEDELWSQNLQAILGDKFKVLNYGFNGAQFSAFGAVAFRILSEKFPKIIFASTCTFAGEEKEIDGGELYGYLFWDAYYKHLFHPDKNEKTEIAQLRKRQIVTYKGIELHVMSYLDSLFYFRNLWNAVAYQYFFTIYNKNTYPRIFKARKYFEDDIFDNKSLAQNLSKDDNHFKEEMHVFNIMDFPSLVDFNKGHCIPVKSEEILNTFNNVFASRHRSKILCILSTYNPKNLSRLKPNQSQAYKIIMQDTRSILQSLGYSVIQTSDMIPDDYIDMMHYVASGGRKIAKEVAPLMVKMADSNKYNRASDA